MNEYSQITFDFFTPPSAAVKKSHAEKPAEPDESTSKPEPTAAIAKEEEIIEVVFPDQISSTASDDLDITTDKDQSLVTPAIPEVVGKSTRGRKSLKSLAMAVDLLNIPEDDILFQKQYYSIGEVSEMFQVNASLLRFWESEFDIIQPRKNRKGDRHFRPIDIKNLQLIYDLLRRRKLTIEGAKDFLKRNSKAKERFETIQNLRKIRSFLAELKGSL